MPVTHLVRACTCMYLVGTVLEAEDVLVSVTHLRELDEWFLHSARDRHGHAQQRRVLAELRLEATSKHTVYSVGYSGNSAWKQHANTVYSVGYSRKSA